MSRPRALLTVLAAALGACSSNPGNPFANSTQTVAPRADSAIVFTSNSYLPVPGAPRELFAIEASGAGLVRLTFCNVDPRRCDTSEAAPAPDRQRMALLRVTDDLDGNGRLTGADGQSLLVVDLNRAVEGLLFPQGSGVSGIDWARGGEVLVYSAVGEGTVEDLYRVDPNGQNNRNLTATAVVRERRPRIDPSGSVAVYERIEADGKGAIFIFNSTLAQTRVTSGGPGNAPLGGTPYVVGSDADPDYSPDGRTIVFRRLTDTGNGGLGTWDVLTVKPDGSGLAVVASGPAFRGAPDWGPQGILFAEVDVAAGTSQLVVVQPDGTGRRSILSVPATLDISNPRWLP
jgi:Tol biopolymer transport system component